MLLQADWNEYGEDGFDFVLLEDIDRCNADTRFDKERTWIQCYTNSGDGCYNSVKDIKMPPAINDIPLHELTFEEAVLSGYLTSCDCIPTTVMLPVWIRREVSIINLDTDITQGNIYTAMVHHGTALLQEMTNPYTTNLHNDLCK
jgi:hypothetical protein